MFIDVASLPVVLWDLASYGSTKCQVSFPLAAFDRWVRSDKMCY